MQDFFLGLCALGTLVGTRAFEFVVPDCSFVCLLLRSTKRKREYMPVQKQRANAWNGNFLVKLLEFRIECGARTSHCLL